MATAKKTQTPKKTTVKKAPAKKASAKKGNAPVKARPQTWRFYVVTIGIFLVAVATVVVIALFTANVVAKHTQQARLDQITGIYDSLHLDQAPYITVHSNVFGDKRVYEADKSRTRASSIEYVYGDTVSNTVADLDARIKEAGFTLVSDQGSSAKVTRYNYKSANNEYLHLVVMSKQLIDVSENAVAMNKSAVPAIEALDTNAGPASVTIMVNLDDDNE